MSGPGTPTARVAGGGSPRLAAAAIALLLAAFVSIAVADRLREPAAAPLASTAAALTASPPAAIASTPSTSGASTTDHPRLEARLVLDGERLTTVPLSHDAAGGYSAYVTSSSGWWPRAPDVIVVWLKEDEQAALIYAPLSLRDARRPGRLPGPPTGRLRLGEPMRGISHWEYRVQVGGRRSSGLTIEIELWPTFP